MKAQKLHLNVYLDGKMYLDFRKVKYDTIVIFEMGKYNVSPTEKSGGNHTTHCPEVDTRTRRKNIFQFTEKLDSWEIY